MPESMFAAAASTKPYCVSTVAGAAAVVGEVSVDVDVATVVLVVPVFAVGLGH